jgi:senataxin
MCLHLQFKEGVTPTAYAFAVVEQRGGKDKISLRAFVEGEIKNLDVTKPVKSSRLQRIASIFSTKQCVLSVLKVSSVVIKDCLSFHASLSYCGTVLLDVNLIFPFGKYSQMCSLSTILREYSAMHSIASHPFKDLILSASEKNKDGDDQNRAWNVPEPLMDYLKTNLNGSQLDAVNVSILSTNI